MKCKLNELLYDMYIFSVALLTVCTLSGKLGVYPDDDLITFEKKTRIMYTLFSIARIPHKCSEMSNMIGDVNVYIQVPNIIVKTYI